jgi:hypothetical protein
MNRYKVLLPLILLEQWVPHFWVIEYNNMKYAVIDEVSYVGTAEDARQSLIDHDWYSPYIVLL